MDCFSQWETTCPKCNTPDSLFVIKLTLANTGEILYPDCKLNPDGFIFSTTRKNCSTENELIECKNCKATFELCELHKIPTVVQKKPNKMKEKTKVYVVITTVTLSYYFEDSPYYGDILLITKNKKKAYNLRDAFNRGEYIEGIDRDNLTSIDGEAKCLEMNLDEVINNAEEEY